MIGKLETGEVPVGVPLEDGVIQIDVKKRAATHRLAVKVGESDVSIRREDGEDLRIDIHKPTMDPLQPLERVSVLGEPAAQVLVRRSPGEDVCLVDNDSLQVRDRAGFEEFLVLVVKSALENQRQ